MQILIISIPSGETVSALSYVVDGEIFIGQGRNCQILLPDRKQAVAERHARIFREDGLWYVENLSTGELAVNSSPVQPGQSMRHLLRDGDMIYCGGYCLMVSDFSPWSNDARKPPVTSVTGENEEDFDSPAEDSLTGEEITLAEQLDDPFLQHELQREVLPSSPGSGGESGGQGEDLFAGFTVENSGSVSVNFQVTELIDVLARDDEEDEWSINRNLRLSPVAKAEQDQAGPCPDPAHRGELPRHGDWDPRDILHHEAVIDAILEALDLMVADFSPDNLGPLLFPMEQRKTDGVSEKERGEGISDMNFWQQYQDYYHCLMRDGHYHRLFLQRLRGVVNR